MIFNHELTRFFAFIKPLLQSPLSHLSELNGVRLSPHFNLSEFLNVDKYPDNKPTMQHVANMTYGCLMLLEPAREVIGCPIIINSGFRCEAVNRRVGGVADSASGTTNRESPSKE